MAYQSQLKKLRSPNLRIYVGVFLAIFLIMFILFHYANRTEELYQLHRRPDLGGFQLEFLSLSRVINHMTCYNSSALIGWNYKGGFFSESVIELEIKISRQKQ